MIDRFRFEFKFGFFVFFFFFLKEGRGEEESRFFFLFRDILIGYNKIIATLACSSLFTRVLFCFSDGSLSDTAIGLNVEDSSRRGRKSSPGSKSGSGSSSGGGSAVQYQSGLGKKSNSTSQLSATGNTSSH